MLARIKRGKIPQPTTAEASGGRFPQFRALGYRDFRILWTGSAVSAVGTWMQIVALGLLVLDLTHGSAAALGAVSLAQALSFLFFSPIGGSAADRFDKRRLLLLTQSIMMGLAVLLGILTMAGMVRFWMIPLFVFVSSAALSFDQPARNALIASFVPKEHLMNAVALQSAVFNGASILGPVLAGLALSRIGYSGNFFLNAASYCAVLVALLLLKTSSWQETARPVSRVWDSVREALRYVRQDAVLPSVVSIYGALLFFGPSAALMVPWFARQILHVGPGQLGLLFSAVGTGTVCSALIIATLGDLPYKTRLVFGSILLWMMALLVFGLSGSLLVSVSALFVLGAAQNAAGSTTITLLQTRVPPEMRGRAMGLNTLLIMCVRPLGDFPAGMVISTLGLRFAVVLSAAIVGVIWLMIVLSRRVVRTEGFRGG